MLLINIKKKKDADEIEKNENEIKNFTKIVEKKVETISQLTSNQEEKKQEEKTKKKKVRRKKSKAKKNKTKVTSSDSTPKPPSTQKSQDSESPSDSESNLYCLLRESETHHISDCIYNQGFFP
ncbi:hypothetical protein QVD17_34860 [Tagetes erecta]|uniref:Uncharacterized protein n=1 Tax=Tagetes erecta TaxID=13708 RepID=A0AAD8K017_TARER|nr:hypothetical protein QVD17_34860 [Tagetes erecta]